MAKAKSQRVRIETPDSSANNPENHGLLSAGSTSDDEEDTPSHSSSSIPPPPSPAPPAISTNLKNPRTPRTPRTPNRVRFDLPDPEDTPPPKTTTDPPPSYEDSSASSPRLENQSAIPLLTGITPPSDSPRTEPWGIESNFEEWQEEEFQRPKSSLPSAFMNMANSIIGAGIIGQPYALRQAGLTTGLFLLIALTITVDWTIRLIVINSKLSGQQSFQGTVEFCFGKGGLIGISVAQWAFAFGGMVAFGIIVGDTIPSVLRAVWPGLVDTPVLGLLADRRVVIVVLILGISLPLSLYRDIAKLAKASTLALISMVIIVFTVVTQGFTVPEETKGSIDGLVFINGGIFQAIGIISFAFVCHHNSLLIYTSLKTPTIDRFTTVTHYSTTISLLFCALLALAGFLTFTSATKANILNNFPLSNPMVNLARLCFGLNMLTTLPLEAFVCREVINNYYFPTEPFNMSRHLIISAALVVSACVLSTVTCDLGAVFELIGATSACALAYILPPMCYLKLASRSWRTVPAVACVVFGFLVMGISLVQALIKIFGDKGAAQICQ